MNSNYRQFNPSELLQPYVDSYWFLEDEVPNSKQMLDRVVPTVRYGLIFTYCGQSESKQSYQNNFSVNPSGIFASVTHYPVFVKSQGKRGVFGVRLKPHTVKMLLKIPAVEVANHTLAIQDVLGAEGKVLSEQIMNASGPEERIRLVESFLAFRLLRASKHENEAVKYAIWKIRQNLGNIPLRPLAEECNVSERQLQRLFLQHVGVSPKFFARTVRINHVFDLLKITNDRLWHDIVFHCGYFDQSHFIKEFKEFSGVTPEVFFRSTSIVTDIFQGNKGEIVEEKLMFA